MDPKNNARESLSDLIALYESTKKAIDELKAKAALTSDETKLLHELLEKATQTRTDILDASNDVNQSGLVT